MHNDSNLPSESIIYLINAVADYYLDFYSSDIIGHKLTHLTSLLCL